MESITSAWLNKDLYGSKVLEIYVESIYSEIKAEKEQKDYEELILILIVCSETISGVP